MAFDRKEVEKEKPKTILWTLLKWYWLIVPTMFYLFIVPNVIDSSNGVLHSGDAFNLALQLLNYGLGGLMMVINPLERSKTGVADNFLKMAVAQQFLAQNIFGLILSAILWFQLPYKVTEDMVEPEELEKWHFQPKTILIIMGVILGISLLIVVGQLTLSFA